MKRRTPASKRNHVTKLISYALIICMMVGLFASFPVVAKEDSATYGFETGMGEQPMFSISGSPSKRGNANGRTDVIGDTIYVDGACKITTIDRSVEIYRVPDGTDIETFKNATYLATDIQFIYNYMNSTATVDIGTYILKVVYNGGRNSQYVRLIVGNTSNDKGWYFEPIAKVDWNGHTYHLYDEAMTWKEAKQYCENSGGYLATITSADEQKSIEQLFSNVKSLRAYWLGGYKDTDWRWLTGESFNYSNWANGQPSGGNDMFLQIFSMVSGYPGQEMKWDDTWNAGDLGGGIRQQGFICEFGEYDVKTDLEQNPVLKAKMLINNHSYKFYKESDMPHAIIANELGDATLMDGYYTLTEDILNGKSTNFYEIILYEILIENFENKELLTNIADTIEENAVTAFVDACNEMYDDTLGNNYYMTAEFLDGAIDEEKLIKFTQFSGFPKALDFLNYHFEKGQKTFKTYRELVNAIRYAYMLNAVGDLQIEALEQIALCSSNSELTSATNSFVTKIKNAKTNPEIIFAMELGKFGIEALVDTLKDEIDKNFISKSPYGLLYKYAYKTGKFVSDNVYNASELSYDALCIIAINEIDKAMVTSLDVLELDLNNHPTTENAEILIFMADAYKKLLLYGDDICISYIEGVKEGQVKSNAFKKFLSATSLNPVLVHILLGGKDADCDSVLSSLNSIDWCIETSDWYSGDEDYSYYMSEIRSTNYSSWAKEPIDGLINLNILPQHLRGNYTENITRAEFATLVRYFVEVYTGKKMYSFLKDNELPMISVPFDDALFQDVDYLYRMGIAKGRTERTFDPLATITREEAAVMITRLLKILGKDTYAYDYNLPGISSWAKDSVNYVYEKGIMSGDGTGFNPKGTFTKEQTLAVLWRIYWNVKEIKIAKFQDDMDKKFIDILAPLTVKFENMQENYVYRFTVLSDSIVDGKVTVIDNEIVSDDSYTISEKTFKELGRYKFIIKTYHNENEDSYIGEEKMTMSAPMPVIISKPLNLAVVYSEEDLVIEWEYSPYLEYYNNSKTALEEYEYELMIENVDLDEVVLDWTKVKGTTYTLQKEKLLQGIRYRIIIKVYYNGEYLYSDACNVDVFGVATIDQWKGHSYYVFDGSLSMYDAQKYCESLGGNLVSIDSKEENEFIEKLLCRDEVSGKTYYIGAIYNNGETFKLTGEKSNYTNWSEDGTDVYGYSSSNYYAVSIIRDCNTGTTSDKHGKWKIPPAAASGFVCEFDN